MHPSAGIDVELIKHSPTLRTNKRQATTSAHMYSKHGTKERFSNGESEKSKRDGNNCSSRRDGSAAVLVSPQTAPEPGCYKSDLLMSARQVPAGVSGCGVGVPGGGVDAEQRIVAATGTAGAASPPPDPASVSASAARTTAVVTAPLTVIFIT